MMADQPWACDAPISMPTPPKRPIMVSFDGGFGFTTGGIAHDMSQAQKEELATPFFAPDPPATSGQ